MQSTTTLPRPLAVAERNSRVAIRMIIVSETVFFLAFFTAFFYLRELPSWETAAIRGQSLLVPFINTILLLASGITMHLAYRAIRANEQRRFENLLLVTMLLGSGFILGQVYEFSRLDFVLSDGPFASTFLMMMGVHALHVAIGILIFIVVHLRASLGHFHAQRYMPVEMCAIYWYFVALVWIALVATLYFL